MNIGDVIKNRRKELGMTQQDFAKLLDVNVATISRWESGDIKNMRRDKVAKISETLDIPISLLMGWDQSSSDRLFERLMLYYRMLTAENKEELVRYAEFMHQYKGDKKWMKDDKKPEE